MKSLFTPIFVCLLCAFSAHSQVVISEIMYNPPESGTDSLEYIEITNVGDVIVDLSGYSFSQGIDYTFDNVQLAAGDYAVVCVNAVALQTITGYADGLEWTSGGLSNGGEAITLIDAAGVEVDMVTYDDGGAWPSSADGTDGEGSSIELCNVDLDNSDGANWKASNNTLGTNADNNAVLGTPGAAANSDLCADVTGNTPVAGDLVITEIMYDDPSTEDSLEFVEVVNNSDDLLDLSGVTLSSTTMSFTFPAGATLAKQSFMVVCKDQAQMQAIFGLSPMEWGAGSLDNSMDAITVSLGGVTIDEVSYTNTGSWPAAAGGFGGSLTLCDANADNNDSANWQAALTIVANQLGGATILANPGSPSVCEVSIAQIRANDADGLVALLGSDVLTRGIVHGLNARNGGLEFSLIDTDDQVGVAIFSASDDFGYTVVEGDIVQVSGTVAQFNGLVQVVLSSLDVLSTGADLVTPRVVTAIQEADESYLITIENVSVVNQNDWAPNGAGFNVELTNGTDTYTMRIDAETDIFNMTFPEGTFDLIGIGGQFDSSSPYDEGYQILPRYAADISPYNTTAVEYPVRTISSVIGNDADGVALESGLTCTIQGVLHGVNLSDNNIQMTVIDPTSLDGIAIFGAGADATGLAEGQEVSIKGMISQFNGLTQILIEEISEVSTLSAVDATVVTSLNEFSESKLVRLNNLSLVDASQWLGDGSSFNVEFTDGTNTYAVRIDNNTDLSSMSSAIADGQVDIIGIGGQFDSSEPLDEGYQLLPRYMDDIQIRVGTADDIDKSIIVTVSPNPSSDWINIDAEINFEQLSIFNNSGALVRNEKATQRINITDLANGTYILQLSANGKRYIQTFVKM